MSQRGGMHQTGQRKATVWTTLETRTDSELKRETSVCYPAQRVTCGDWGLLML